MLPNRRRFQRHFVALISRRTLVRNCKSRNILGPRRRTGLPRTWFWIHQKLKLFSKWILQFSYLLQVDWRHFVRSWEKFVLQKQRFLVQLFIEFSSCFWARKVVGSRIFISRYCTFNLFYIFHFLILANIERLGNTTLHMYAF